MMRRSWVGLDGGLPVVRQCALAWVSRATVYARSQQKKVDGSELLLCRLIDEEYY